MDQHAIARSYVPAPFTQREQRRFKLGEPGETRWPFPDDYSERKSYLFNHTGYIAKRMDWRGWYCLNTAINRGLGLGLPEHGRDRTLLMLSLIDHSLGEVPRWVKARKVHTQRADSTAAHSKQSLNLIHAVFEDSGVAARIEKSGPHSPMAKLRRDALLGAWIHDMGEVILEVTTATDSFSMTKEERETLTDRRHALEDEVFVFACDLAAHMIEQGTPEQFNAIIWKLREAALNAHIYDAATDHDPALHNELLKATLPAQQTILRLNALEKGLAHYKKEFGFTDQHAPETQELLRISDRAEGKVPGDFLRPLLKALESIEGQRYLQRNAGQFATDRLSRLMHGPNFPAQTLSTQLSDDHDIVESVKRCEKFLRPLFDTAKSPDEKALAESAARFVYRSLARQFDPEPGEQVGVTCDIIDRKPTRPEQVHNLTIGELERIRGQEQAYKAERLAHQPANDNNGQYMTRQRAAHMYNAAADLVGDRAFKPELCLLEKTDTSVIPTLVVHKMLQRERLAERGELPPTPEFPAQPTGRGLAA